jgi:hypothetical protein
MARLRRSSELLVDDTIDAFVAAIADLDIRSVDAVAPPPPFDGAIHAVVDDRPLMFAIAVKAYGTGPAARQVIDRPEGLPEHVVPVLVADRMTADARALLTEAGWSWLDRGKGRLHLRGPGVRVDADVAATARAHRARGAAPIAGRSGVTVAYWLLSHPGRAVSPSGDAPTLGLAPSTISTTVRRLLEAGLLDAERHALTPELFWELASVWQTDRSWVASPPDPRRHRPPDPGAPTWRRTGTAAAAAWGAPVVSAEGGPVELYVPGEVDVSIAQRRYGPAAPGAGAAVLLVPPAALVVAAEGDSSAPEVDGWLVAPRLAVALDLAQDRARGREILEGWEVDDAVWR